MDLGLSRKDGPYLVTAGDRHGSDAELIVGASVALGELTSPALDECNDRDPNLETTDLTLLKGFNSDRCVLGELGFLFATLRDGNDTGDDDKTEAALRAEIDLTSGGADADRLTFPEIVAGKANLDVKVGASANVDLRIRTGSNIPGDASRSADFPSVLGRFHLNWEWTLGHDSGDPTELAFDALYLDAGTFITDLLGPTVEEAQRILGPFKPFIDFVGEIGMTGGPGFDFMTGDNAVVARTLVGGAWQPNTFNGGIQHEPVFLRDINSPDTAVVSGGDTMFGNGDDDVMYGQGGNDEMHGGVGHDYMEGNAADDDCVPAWLRATIGPGGGTSVRRATVRRGVPRRCRAPGRSPGVDGTVLSISRG